MKQSLKLCAICALAIILLTSLWLPAAAAEPVYEFSGAYQSSPYYQNLLACELTGDERYDVLAIAFTQLGYHEGNSDAEMGGANGRGDRNFAEYNRMYGKLDNGEGNGMSYGYSWCAAFVSWCLRHAQVSEEAAVTEVSCRRMTDWYRKNSTFYARESGYEPKPGDIIMFHDGDGVAHHVGLVLGTAGERVYVIDGNGREESVATHDYRRSSRAILGYCVPDYETRPGTVYDFLPETTAPDVATVTVSVTVVTVIMAVGAWLAMKMMRSHKQKLVNFGKTPWDGQEETKEEEKEKSMNE